MIKKCHKKPAVPSKDTINVHLIFYLKTMADSIVGKLLLFPLLKVQNPSDWLEFLLFPVSTFFRKQPRAILTTWIKPEIWFKTYLHCTSSKSLTEINFLQIQLERNRKTSSKLQASAEMWHSRMQRMVLQERWTQPKHPNYH